MKKRGLRTAIDYLKSFGAELIPEVLHKRAGIDIMVHTLSHSMRRLAKGGQGEVLVSYHPDNSGVNIAYYRYNPAWTPQDRTKRSEACRGPWFCSVMGCAHPSAYFSSTLAILQYCDKYYTKPLNIWTGTHEAPILLEKP